MRRNQRAIWLGLILIGAIAAPAGAQQTISGQTIRTGTTPLTALAQSGAADQQVVQWSAANGRWQPGTAAGTVTSVGLSMPSIFSVTGSPITGSGTFTVSLASQSAYTFLGVGAGGGTPSFIAIPAAAIPSLPASIITSGQLAVAQGGTGQSSYTDGQLLIGDSSTGGLDKATLTAGSNVTITNGHGSITIAASGGSGGSPTVSKVFASGSSYANTASWAACALGNGTLAVTLPSSGYYHLFGNVEVDGGYSSSGSIFGIVLYDSAISAYLPYSLSVFSPVFSTGVSSTSKVFIPIDCVYNASGADTVQVYSYGSTITSSSSPTAEGSVLASRSWLAYEPVSSSSGNNQITNSFPSGLSPVSNYDASAITGVSNGGNVTSWSDSGSAGLALAPSGGSPTYATYVSNFWQGMPAVEFQGSTTKYVTSSVPTSSTSYDIRLRQPTMLIFTMGIQVPTDMANRRRAMLMPSRRSLGVFQPEPPSIQFLKTACTL